MIILTKIVSSTLLIVIPLVSFAQDEGIQFTQSLSWKEVLTKAKVENKYIFIDCYATWCGPCKYMDKYIYTTSEVGCFYNSNFISIKMQMDTGISDPQLVKLRYADANMIMNQYKIKAYPTFLFFSKEGNLLNKSIGQKVENEFIAIGKDALDPRKQYYRLLNNYKQGIKNYSTMPYLVYTSVLLEDKGTTNVISKDYLNNYLLHFPKEKLFIKENLDFYVFCFNNGLIHSKDNAFTILYRNFTFINKITGDSTFVQRCVDFVISKEFIEPKLSQRKNLINDNPDWVRIHNAINRRFDKNYADRTVMFAKERWYLFKQKWPEFTKNEVNLVEHYGISMTRFDLNEHAWNVFIYSTDKKEIEAGVHWMEKALKTEFDSTNVLPASLDTYANLLYKSGKQSEAILIEEKALNMAIEHNNEDFKKTFQITLTKFRNREPTWPEVEVRMIQN